MDNLQHAMLDVMPRVGAATAADIELLERHEVVRGEIVRKALPVFRHSFVQGRIVVALAGFHGQGSGAQSPGGWWLGTEPTIELALHEVYQPDVAGWRLEHVPELDEYPIRLVPDWVCEILSPSTADRDLGHKLRAYHRAHVGHYWIVEPTTQTLTVYRWQEASYTTALTARAGERVRAEPFDAIEIALASVFDLPPPARGR
ncbi:MAG TPA: Uma2 family endonuclease [Haliangium sp.]|nr:Uma2 family endonuclease [Haliangium sp.]